MLVMVNTGLKNGGGSNQPQSSIPGLSVVSQACPTLAEVLVSEESGGEIRNEDEHASNPNVNRSSTQSTGQYNEGQGDCNVSVRGQDREGKAMGKKHVCLFIFHIQHQNRSGSVLFYCLVSKKE